MAQQIPGARTGQAGEQLSWLPLIVSALVVAHVIALVNISIPHITSYLEECTVAAIFVRFVCVRIGFLHRPGVLVYPNSIGCCGASISASQLEEFLFSLFHLGVRSLHICSDLIRLAKASRLLTGFCESLVCVNRT